MHGKNNHALPDSWENRKVAELWWEGAHYFWYHAPWAKYGRLNFRNETLDLFGHPTYHHRYVNLILWGRGSRSHGGRGTCHSGKTPQMAKMPHKKCRRGLYLITSYHAQRQLLLFFLLTCHQRCHATRMQLLITLLGRGPRQRGWHRGSRQEIGRTEGGT